MPTGLLTLLVIAAICAVIHGWKAGDDASERGGNIMLHLLGYFAIAAVVYGIATVIATP